MRRWIGTMGLAGALLAVGCAGTLPPARALTPGDLQRLGGMWAWTARFQSPARLGPGPMRVRLVDGRMSFQTASATGTLAFHEGDGRRVLDGEGVSKSGGEPFRVQLTQRGSKSLEGTADAALTWLALVIEE